MPHINPSFPLGPYRFVDREYMIISYESDPDAIRAVIPAPLEPAPGNVVLYEWINMPDSTGFGSYSESGTVIPCIMKGPDGADIPINFTLNMFLDCEPPIAGGREIWGFPKKFANPECKVVADTLVGRLSYGGMEIAKGTMAYKHTPMDKATALKSLTKRQSNLKIIPAPDWSPGIAQLVGYSLCDVDLKFAYEGPARLELIPHISAPVADLPIRRVLGGKHIMADITLPHGTVLHDYIKHEVPGDPRRMGGFTRQHVLTTVSMPHQSPSYSRGPVRLTNRDHVLIRYRTDAAAIRRLLPEQLVANAENEVLVEWVSTHGSGLGEYGKVSQYIPCTVAATGQEVNFQVQGYADNSSPITAGREVLGQPHNFAYPQLRAHRDTTVGTLKYGDVDVALGTVAYKHNRLASEEAVALLAKPQVNLKIIPGATGAVEIAQLVSVAHADIAVKAAHVGPARLHLIPHVNAPLADLPVREVLAGYEVRADMTLPPGLVIHDYVAAAGARAAR